MRWLARYLFARLREPSTWRGLVAIAAGLGVAITPELADALMATGLALMGLIGALAPDALGEMPRETRPPGPADMGDPDRLRRDAADGLPPEPPLKPPDPFGWQKPD